MTAQSDNRPGIYREDDLIVARFSSAGACIKVLVSLLLGEEPSEYPEWMLEKFAEGHRAEDAIMEAFARGDWGDGGRWNLLDPGDYGSYKSLPRTVNRKPSFGQFEVELPIGKHIVIRGKLDGIGELYHKPMDWQWNMGQKVVVEAKAFGRSYWDKFVNHGIEAFPHYQAQVALQMAATGRPCAFVVGRKWTKEEDGPTGEFTGEIRVQYITDLPVPIAEIKGRIIRAWSFSDKIERGTASIDDLGCDIKQWPCPFFHLYEHGEDKDVEVIDVDDTDQPFVMDGLPYSLDELAELYTAGVVREKEGKAIKDEVKRAVQTYLGERRGALVQSGRYTIEDVIVAQPERTVKAYEQRFVKVKER